MKDSRPGLVIEHIRIGFDSVIQNKNYADCHQALKPFGLRWGRGILIRGSNYLEAVTGPYGTTHSHLKSNLDENEHTAGSFYYGYDINTRTLYLEYASDTKFDFRDEEILQAIMNSLTGEHGPLKNLRVPSGN